MSGKATFTTVTSRKPMNTATDVTIRTFQRRSMLPPRRPACKVQGRLARSLAFCNPCVYAHTMPLRTYDQKCSIARALQVVGERWTLLVLREVFTGHRRFEQIQRSLGVATNILSDRLQTLIDEGILE